MESKILTHCGAASLALILFCSARAGAATISPSNDILLSSNGGVGDINGAAMGGFGTVGANFNDGNRDGIYGDGSTTHSIGGGSGNYMEVTIPTASIITSVNLFNRTDPCCGGRIDGAGANPYTLTIYNGAAVAFTEDLTFTPTITDTNVSGQAITLPTFFVGDRVRITQNYNDYQNLAELEAFAPEPGMMSLIGCAGVGLLARRRARA